MKTAQELINDFIPEVREKLQKLLDNRIVHPTKDIDGNYYNNHEDLIVNGFIWKKNGGIKYWYNIYENLNDYLIKPDPLPEVYKVEEGERKYSITEIESVITQIISNEPEMNPWDFYKKIIENLKSK